MVCTEVVAGKVTVTKQIFTQTDLQSGAATRTSSEISYELGAAYREGDKITMTFPDGVLAANQSFGSVNNVPPVNSDDSTKAIAGITMGLLNSDAKSVTYRVTKLTLAKNLSGVELQNSSTLGAVIQLGKVDYNSAAVLAGPVTVNFSSQTSAGDVLDSAGTRTATLVEVGTPPVVVPTLSEWGVILLLTGLAGAALWRVRQLPLPQLG